MYIPANCISLIGLKLGEFLSRVVLFLCLNVVGLNLLMAQKINTINSNDSIVLSKYHYPGEILNDTAAIKHFSKKILNRLYSQGYIEASYKINTSDSIPCVNWFVGSKYEWIKLSEGNVPEYILSKSGYRERLYQNSRFDLLQIQKLFDNIIEESENNGYPFAHLSFLELKIKDGLVEAALNYESGPEIVFDELVITGTDNIKSSWLSSYLGVKEGTLFSQKTLDNIVVLIDELTYIKLNGTVSVSFQNLTAKVELPLADIPSNSIDGIIGFLPNEETDNKLLITGQLFLGLNNLFNSGKSLQLEWQSLKPRTQLLEINYDHPNILLSPMDMSSRFYLLKEDTIFINREFDLILSFRKERSRMSLFYRSKNSSVISEENVNPDLTDFNINYYGIGYGYSTLPNRIIPKSGFRVKSEAAIGNKTIEDTMIESNKTSVQYSLIANVLSQIRLSRNFVIANQLLGGKLINDRLYQNDLFRIGGLKSLRGFNENFFFAHQYIINRLEFRLHYQSGSYVYCLYDQGYYYANTQTVSIEDYPLGIGLGIAMELDFGILNIAYALGRSDNQKFDTRLSKFHFGYIARF